MKKIAVTALGVFSLFGLFGSFAEARSLEQIKKSGTLRIATEGAFPPFNYFKGKDLTGFEVELAELLAKELDLKIKWTTLPFDNLLIGLNQGRYDFVIASHGITPQRAKAVDFSKPHYCTGGAIVSKKGGPKTAKDLNGKTVAVQVGTTYLKNVETIKGIKSVQTFPKDTDAQAALMANRVDAWVGDKFTGIDLVKAQKGKLQQGELLFSERVGMAVQKGNTALLNQLNQTLKKVQKNGKYGKLSKKYFKQDVRCK